MKLTEAQLRDYYASQGIRREDLRTPDPIELTELPAGVPLTERQEAELRSITDGWNRLDPMSKIDAAYAMERRVLTKKDTPDMKRLEAWAGYLLLTRIHGCEDRRATMEKIARGEIDAPLPRPTRRRKAQAPTTAHAKRG